MGALRITALLFGVCIKAPEFWKLPFEGSSLRMVLDINFQGEMLRYTEHAILTCRHMPLRLLTSARISGIPSASKTGVGWSPAVDNYFQTIFS